LAIAGGTGAPTAILGCTTNPKAAAAGVATFAGCSINLAGNGYALIATSGTLTSATSATFNLFGATDLTIANGGGVGSTVGKAESGDVIKLTWSQAVQLNSVCSTWTSSAQTVTGVTVTMARGNGQNHNDLSLSLGSVGSGSCAGGINLGTFTTTTNAYETGNTTHAFTNSTVTWNAATNQLIITLGGNTSAPNTVGSSTYVFNPDPAIARSGVPAIKAGGTPTTGPVQNF
jgi:hypothetical protein